MTAKTQFGGLHRLAAAAPWFDMVEVRPGLLCLTEPHVVDFMRANIWLVVGRDRDLLVDTGNGIAPLAPVLADRTRERVVVASHAHADHAGGLHEFPGARAHKSVSKALAAADPQATLAGPGYALGDLSGLLVGPARLSGPLATARPASFDPARFGPQPARMGPPLAEGDVIDLGDRAFSVLHVPGHSPGCIALYDPAARFLIAGDAIYDGELVDSLPHSDRTTYRFSLRRLLALPVDLAVAGHGPPMTGARMAELIRAYLGATP